MFPSFFPIATSSTFSAATEVYSKIYLKFFTQSFRICRPFKNETRSPKSKINPYP